MPTHRPSTITTLQRLLPYLKSRWRWIAVGLVASLSVSLLWLLPPFLTKVIIDSAIPTGDASLLVQLVLAVVGVVLLILLLDLAESFCLDRAGHGLVRDLRFDLFNSVQSQSYSFFIHNDRGAINARLWNNVGALQWVFRTALVELIGSILLLTVTLGFMFIWHWELTLLLMGIWPVMFAIGFVVSRWRERNGEAIDRWFDDNASFVHDRLNIDGSILLNGVGYDRAADASRFSEASAKLRELFVRESLSNSIMASLGAVLVTLSAAIVYFYGGFGVMDGDLTLGVLIAFVALSARLAGPVGSLASIQVDLAGSVVHLRRIFEWIDLEPEIRDAPDAIELPTVNGHVSVTNVSVDYKTGRPIISDLSFDFQPGQMTAIVGRSGAGKTTLTHLILRLYDPTDGSVKLDGHDMRSVKIASLREHLSLVPQDSAVHNTSVRENLLISNSNASESEMTAACKAAQLHDFLVALPDGYDTIVGEYGYRLSGGERQRLAIARVILKQPRIVILDEPTSSLDSITERAIKDALDSTLFRNATTIVIAHRLSTVLNADSIIVLDEGKLIDSGSHEELLRRCPLYRRLYEEQFLSQAESHIPR